MTIFVLQIFKIMSKIPFNTQQKIYAFILQNTDRGTMDCLSTKEVSSEFNISMQEAYKLLCGLSDGNLITKLDPVNGNNFMCCDWVKN